MLSVGRKLLNLRWLFAVVISYFVISQIYKLNYYWEEQNNVQFRRTASTSDYLYEPKCSECATPLNLLIVIKSAIYEFEERRVIRSIWGNQAKRLGMCYFFSVGYSQNITVNKLLMNESNLYHDVLNVNVEEDYHKLTLKTYYNLLWVTKFCTQAQVIYFTDCDTILFPDRLDFLNVSQNDSNIVGGNCWETESSIERRSSMPKYVSRSVWEEDTFPPFCSGAAHYTTLDVIQKLLDVIPNISFSLDWLDKMDFLDDVVFTGILRKWAGVQIKHDDQFNWFYGFNSVSFCRNEVEIKHYVCKLRIISIVNSFRPLTVFQECFDKMTAVKKNC